MKLPERADVVVVGLGPVGAAVACLLGRYGVRVLAVDAATSVNCAPRAIALDHDALRVLQQTGLAEGAFDILPIPRVEMRSPVFGTFARANTTGQVDGHPKLVTFFQPDLEAALRAHLSTFGSVRKATGVEVVEVVDIGPLVRVALRQRDGRTSHLHAQYVVGCDGAASFVRKTMGVALRGQTYGEEWLIADVRKAPRAIDHVEFVCDPARPGPHMPAPRGRQRWEFKLKPGESRERMVSGGSALDLLRPWTGDAEVEIERLAVYRFHAMIAERFSAGRVFVAGDAAHLTPPFAGQGLVSGLRDALNLAWKLAAVVRRRASSEILASYDVERRPHAQASVDLARILGHVIMPPTLGAACVVHGAVRLLELFPPTSRLIGELDIKPKLRFEHGLFRRRPVRGCVDAGEIFPQAIVRYDGRIVPSDEVLGLAPCLVGFGVDPAEQVGPALRAAWLERGGRFVRIGRRGESREADATTRDCEDVAGAFLSSSDAIGWMAVVRPDRVVMCEGWTEDGTRLVAGALGLLGSPVHHARERKTSSAVLEVSP